MSDFMNENRVPVLVQLTGGRVPVETGGTDTGTDEGTLLFRELIWEVRELRRAICDTQGYLFRHYDGNK